MADESGIISASIFTGAYTRGFNNIPHSLNIMKLHLPSSLRKAVLACMTVFTGVSTTVATGVVGVGSLVFVCSSLAQAAEYTITTSSDSNLTTATRNDTVILNLEGYLFYNDAATTSQVQANIQIDKAILTFGKSDYAYIFNRKVTGSGDFSFVGTSGGNNLTFQFAGDMSAYTGNMSIADNKTGTFWFKNNCKTGTGSITALNANSLVKIGTTTVNNSSINAGKIEIVGNATFKNSITLSAVSSITNTGDTWVEGAITLGHSIDNSATLTFFKDITLADSLQPTLAMPEGNGFASQKYQIITGTGNIVLKDGVKIIASDGTVLFTQSGETQTFTGSLGVDSGTTYYIVEAGSNTSAAAISGENGYVLTGAGSVLTVDEDLSALTGSIKVDTGSSAATVVLTSGGKLSDTSLACASGTLNVTVEKAKSDYSDAPVSLELTGSNAINGTLTLKQGSLVTVSGTNSLSSLSGISMAGGAGNEAQMQVTSAAQMGGSCTLSMNGNALVGGNGTLLYTGNGAVAVNGENNSISASLQAGGTLEFDVAHTEQLNGILAVTGNLTAETILKKGTGTLTYGGASVSGKVKVAGGSLVLDSSTALKGLELAGGAVTVNAAKKVSISTLSGGGTITNNGTLTLSAITTSSDISVTGTGSVVAGKDFLKTGTGNLTLAALTVDSSLNMNGHSGLNVTAYNIAAGATLVYGTGDVLSIGSITQTVNLDFSRVLAQLSAGIDTGISATESELAGLEDLLVVDGLTAYELTINEEGRVVLTSKETLNADWDLNWAYETLANAPSELNAKRLGATDKAVALSMAGVEITGGGNADTVVAGGIISSAVKKNTTITTGDTWMKVSGGTFNALVGGNVLDKIADSGAADHVDRVEKFVLGDTHIMMVGGTTQYVIGGIKGNYAMPATMTGDTYVSIYDGATVTGSVIGGSTSTNANKLSVGNTNVFIYTALQSAGYVTGAHFYESGTASNFMVTGNTNVIVDLSDYAGTGTAFDKTVIGGSYMGISTQGYRTEIGGNTNIVIEGKEGVNINGAVVGGTWLDCGYTSKITGDTSLTISGDSKFTGRVMGGTMHAHQGGNSFAGDVNLTIDGGIFEKEVIGGSSLGSYDSDDLAAVVGISSVESVNITVNDGEVKGRLIGGCLVEGSAKTVGVGTALQVSPNEWTINYTITPGDVNIDLNGGSVAQVIGGHVVEGSESELTGTGDYSSTVGDITITVDGATVGRIYGGSYVHSGYGLAPIKQGDITINLESGTLNGAVFAAGEIELNEMVSTETVTINVASEMHFGSGACIYGGYNFLNTKLDKHNAIVGECTLNFTSDAAYSNMVGKDVTVADFDIINVAKGGTAYVYDVVNTSRTLTKTGAGTLEVTSNGLMLDTLHLQAGTLSTKSISSKGLSIDAVVGTRLQVNGDLTLAALSIDMTGAKASDASFLSVHKLSAAADTVQITLSNVKDLYEGEYVLAELTSTELTKDTFLGVYDYTPSESENLKYELVLANNKLVFRVAPMTEWTWTGGASAEWTNSSADNWLATTGTPSGQEVYFSSTGVDDEGKGTVIVNGVVTPSKISVTGGEYTFVAKDTVSSIKLGEDGVLKVGVAGTVNMAMDNASLGGSVDLLGKLVLQSDNALGNADLKFNGGTLVYDTLTDDEGNKTHITTDLSAQSSLATGYTGLVKIEVTDAENSVSWNKPKYDVANSGVEAIFASGIEKTGKGAFSINWEYGSSSEVHTGTIDVKEGVLNLNGVIKGTPKLTFSGAMNVAAGSALNIHMKDGKFWNAAAATFSGSISGAGTVTFGKNGISDGRYAITGNNSSFAGTIVLLGDGSAGNHNFTAFQNGNSFGSANSTVQVNGRGFYFNDKTVTAASNVEIIGASAGNLLGGGSDKVYTFTGAWRGAEDASITAENFIMTVALAGDLSNYKGTLVSAASNTWLLGGTNVAGTGSLDMKALDGSGLFKTQYTTQTTLNAVVAGTASLQQSGKGTLILAADNTTTGKLTVDSACEVQLGSATQAASWVGTALDGAGTFRLVNGSLSGLTTKADSATLAVDVAAGSKVTMDAASAAHADSITLTSGTVLEVTGDAGLTVGGKNGTSLSMTFGKENISANIPNGTPVADVTLGTPLIDAESLTIAGSEGISFNLSNADILVALNNAGDAGEVYLTLVSGTLNVATGISLDFCFNPLLESLGVRALLRDEALAAGSIVINGDVSGIYVTDNATGAAAGKVDNIVVNDASLSPYAAVVIADNDSLTIDAGADSSTAINNLNSSEGSSFMVKSGSVTLNNKLFSSEASLTASNLLEGTMTGADGTQIVVQGMVDAEGNQSGSLTVEGAVNADALRVESGEFTMKSADNRINTLTIAQGAKTFLGAGAELLLKDGTINGVLAGDAGAKLTTTGTVSMGATASTGAIDLFITDGSTFDVGEASVSFNSVAAEVGATLNGAGGTLYVGQPTRGIATKASPSGSSFAGTLSGTGTLAISQGKTFTFDNATGSADWNVENKGSLIIDTTSGNKMVLGDLTLHRGSSFTLHFDSDAGMDVLTLNKLILDSDDTLTLTLHSDGSAQLGAGEHKIGSLVEGLGSMGDSLNTSLEQILNVDFTGTAFSRFDTAQSFVSVNGQNELILTLVMSNKNPFLPAANSTNAVAGAHLLWEAEVPADGDLKEVYNSVNDMVENGKNAAASQLMAAVAGSSVATLGAAYTGDVDRQLRAIRNRTTTMGVNQTVVNEGLPYVNAWVNAEGNHAEMDADNMAAGYAMDSWGGTLGFDVDVDTTLTLGVALTAMYGDITVDGPDKAEGNMDTLYISAFARYAERATTHTFVATIGHMNGSLERTVNYGKGSYTTKGDTDGMAFGLMYEYGKVFKLDEEGEACWQPIVNVAWRSAFVSGFDENGSDAALKVGDQAMHTLTVGGGARMQAIVGENMFNRTVIFEARALAKVDIGDNKSEADVSLLHGRGKGTVESAELGMFGVELGAGLSVPVGDEDGGSLFFDASAEIRDGYTNFNGTVGYRINF